ncbi:MAG: hypothetical protein JSR73_11940 [Proteobacteria bacterium]|nr:hypothetical protein [Pseudomonadota bacterium]
MHPLVERALDEARGAWRFRWSGLIVAWVLALAGWTFLFFQQDVYEAKASLFVDTKTALKPMLAGLAVEQDVNQHLNYARQSLLAGPQLEKIALQTQLLSEADLKARDRELRLNAFRRRINLTVRTANEAQGEAAGTIYSVAYNDSNRPRALRVVQTLLKTLIDETVGGNREGSANAQSFIEARVQEYAKHLSDSEDRLARFKQQNIGMMPGEGGGYFARLQAEMDALKGVEDRLHVAEAKRSELLRQLHGGAPLAAAPAPAAAPAAGGGAAAAAGGDTATRIRETQAKLDELLLRFTEKHPEVIATRATLAELNRRREAELAALRQGDLGAAVATGAGANPVYQALQLGLNQADVDVASLRTELASRQQKVGELRRLLGTMPQIEAELARLNRDYEINRAQYAQMLDRLQKAKLGEAADEAGSVRFEVVQPPTAAFQPVSPLRGPLNAAILMVALVLGAGFAYLLNVLQPVYVSARELAEHARVQVIGTVGTPLTTALRALRLRDRRWFVAGVAGLLVIFVALVIRDQMVISATIDQLSAGST